MRNYEMSNYEFNVARMEALKVAVKPVEAFLNAWCCPHDKLIVMQGNAELLSGEINIPLDVLE